jgi:hypothetical protein
MTFKGNCPLHFPVLKSFLPTALALACVTNSTHSARSTTTPFAIFARRPLKAIKTLVFRAIVLGGATRATLANNKRHLDICNKLNTNGFIIDYKFQFLFWL